MLLVLHFCSELLDASLFEKFKRLIYPHLNSLTDISRNIEVFISDRKQFNNPDIVSFVMDDYPFLHTIDIGDESFVHVTTTIFQNLPSLTSLVIGTSCFFLDESSEIDISSTFILKHCMNLQEVRIGGESFCFTKHCMIEGISFHVYL